MKLFKANPPVEKWWGVARIYHPLLGHGYGAVWVKFMAGYMPQREEMAAILINRNAQDVARGLTSHHIVKLVYAPCSEQEALAYLKDVT